MSARRLVACVLLLALGGCMVGPELRAPAPAAAGSVSRRAGADVGAAPRSARDWWTLYDDPHARRARRDGARRQRRRRAARSRASRRPTRSLREANAALFPEIDLGGRRRAARSSGSVTHAGADPHHQRRSRRAVDVVRDRFLGPAAAHGRERARAQALATHYAKDVVTLSLAGLTAQTYFALRSLDAQIAATRETLATRDD